MDKKVDESVLSEEEVRALQEPQGVKCSVKDTIEKELNTKESPHDRAIIEHIADKATKALTEKPGSSTGEGAFNTKPKTMGNTCQNKCRDNVKDVVMFGDDLFKLLSKASSENEGWMKSTKAFDTGKGVLVQVTTQQRNPDGSYAVAEALSFVPGVKVVEQVSNSDGLIKRYLKSTN